MENEPIRSLLESLRAEEEKRIVELAQAKETESLAIETAASLEILLVQRADELRGIIFDEYYERRRSPLLAKLIGQKTLKVRYGTHQSVSDLGYTSKEIEDVYLPYLETASLIGAELITPEGYEGYSFSQGWVFRIQIGMIRRAKNQYKVARTKPEPYALSEPVGIHWMATEHVTGKTEGELRYLVPTLKENPRHLGPREPRELRVFHNGKEVPLLGLTNEEQLTALGLINRAIEELAS